MTVDAPARMARVQGGVLQSEFYFTFPQHRGLVGRDEPDGGDFTLGAIDSAFAV